jgi:hypothetical protein
MQVRRNFLILALQVIVLCALGGGAYCITRELSTLPQTAEDTIARRFHSTMVGESHDIKLVMNRMACEQTALFIMEHMPKLKMSPSRYALMDHSLEAVGSTKGLYCEFGVAGGDSINYIAGRITGTIHGFDSFEGLPETWRPNYEKGTFSVVVLPHVRENVLLYKGWFDKSLPVWTKKNPGPIAFMHMDADLYSSTKCVFDLVADRIVPGTVIQFDEYFNYPGWQQGEFKAFKEFVEWHHVDFEYLGYSDQQVAVRITGIGAKKGK